MGDPLRKENEFFSLVEIISERAPVQDEVWEKKNKHFFKINYGKKEKNNYRIPAGKLKIIISAKEQDTPLKRKYDAHDVNSVTKRRSQSNVINWIIGCKTVFYRKMRYVRPHVRPKGANQLCTGHIEDLTPPGHTPDT